ncbi:hypothetical protein FQN51_000931 [Onygenales sp. PD_10]|nr:hypothetical protein FQN51_000931 [Onygenales sp. PD_10]
MRSACHVATALLGVVGLSAASPANRPPSDPALPPPPAPGPIVVTKLTLPPVVSSDTVGACALVNPHDTGCIPIDSGLHSGNFLPDNKHVVAVVAFVGAPAAPDPASIYSACSERCTRLSLSVQRRQANPGRDQHYRLWLGAFDEFSMYSRERSHLSYPLRQSGGWLRASSFGVFNPSPTSGALLSSRYDLINVTTLFDPAALLPLSVQGSQIKYNPEAVSVGELRGFSQRGNKITYVRYPRESFNLDAFAADPTTGKIRRLTSHPEYVDPLDTSPDDEWMVVMDTRGTDRQMWLSGMRGVPPMTDLVSSTVTSSTRNNGCRRFFVLWLIDRHGDREPYFRLKINAAGDGSPGSVSNPEWNGLADLRWSNDGTHIVYTQEITISPACGGANPPPGYASTEPGGRIQRIMLAKLPSREPLNLPPVSPVSDVVPWVSRMNLAALPQTSVRNVAVKYNNLSDDGVNFLNGAEEVTGANPSLTLNHIDWYSTLERTGTSISTKTSGPSGFHLDIDVLENIFNANGTLTTIIDGVVYRQPLNGV